MHGTNDKGDGSSSPNSMAKMVMAGFESTIRGDHTVLSRAEDNSVDAYRQPADTTGRPTCLHPEVGAESAARSSAQVNEPISTTTNMNADSSQSRRINDQVMALSTSNKKQETQGLLDPSTYGQVGNKEHISIEKERLEHVTGLNSQLALDRQVLDQSAGSVSTFGQLTIVAPKPRTKLPDRRPTSLPVMPSLKRLILPPQSSANKPLSISKAAEGSKTLGGTAFQQQPARLPVVHRSMSSYTQPQAYPQLQFRHYQPLVAAPPNKRKHSSEAEKTANMVPPVDEDSQGKSKRPRLADTQARVPIFMNNFAATHKTSRETDKGSCKDAPLPPFKLDAPLGTQHSLTSTSSIARNLAGNEMETIQSNDLGNPRQNMEQSKVHDSEVRQPSYRRSYIENLGVQSLFNGPAPPAPLEAATDTLIYPRSFQFPTSYERTKLPDISDIGSIDKSSSHQPGMEEINKFGILSSIGSQKPPSLPTMNPDDSREDNRMTTPKSTEERRGVIGMRFPPNSGMKPKHFGTPNSKDQDNSTNHSTNQSDTVSGSNDGNGGFPDASRFGVPVLQFGVFNGPHILIDPRLVGLHDLASMNEGLHPSGLGYPPRFGGNPHQTSNSGVDTGRVGESRVPHTLIFPLQSAEGGSSEFGTSMQQADVASLYPNPENMIPSGNHSNPFVNYSKSSFEKPSTKFPDMTSGPIPNRQSTSAYDPFSNVGKNPRVVNQDSIATSEEDSDSSIADGKVARSLRPSSGVLAVPVKKYSNHIVDYSKSPYKKSPRRFPAYMTAPAPKLSYKSPYAQSARIDLSQPRSPKTHSAQVEKSSRVLKGPTSAKSSMGTFDSVKSSNKTTPTVTRDESARLKKEQELRDQTLLRTRKAIEAAQRLFPTIFNNDSLARHLAFDASILPRVTDGSIGVEAVASSFESLAAKLNQQADILRRLGKFMPDILENIKSGSDAGWEGLMKHFEGKDLENFTPEDLMVYSWSLKVTNERS